MVYYAAYYSLPNSSRVRNPAGEDKINYIAQCINEVGEEVLIVSNAKNTGKKFAYKEHIHLFGKTNLLLFSSLAKSNFLLHAIDVLWGYFQLVLFVLSNVKSTDTVLVYHSLGYRGLWGILHHINRFNYILEVEELYSAFEASKSSYKKFESNVFKHPDGFLFSNVFLEKYINLNDKPYAIINGIYHFNQEAHLKKSDSKDFVKVVYAGSLEHQKGVDFVIEACAFLPKNYEICIIGFGSENDLLRVNNLIDDLTLKGFKVRFDGFLQGDKYISYLQNCDIGICIQDELDAFNQYEFPSKIFSYLANGLQVVTNDLIQLSNSEVYPYLHISKGTSPEAIAKAIISCEFESYNPESILNQLDDSFKTNIKKIL